jgi:hypothetical protein
MNGYTGAERVTSVAPSPTTQNSRWPKPLACRDTPICRTQVPFGSRIWGVELVVR